MSQLIHWKEEVEQVVGVSLPESTFAHLVTSGLLDRYRAGAVTIDALAEEVFRLFRATGQPLPTEPSPGGGFLPAGRESDTLSGRDRAVSILFADEASRESVVRTFRQDVLGDKLVPWPSLKGWANGMQDSDLDQWREREGVPAGEPLSIQCLPRLLLVFPGSSIPTTYLAAPGGTLEQLWSVAFKLEHSYGWRSENAAVFVVSGEVPRVASIDSTVTLRRELAASRIAFSIDPTVTPRDLAESYRRLRGEILINQHRSLSDKHTRLASFPAEVPQLDSWEERLQAWNSQYPEWAYEASRLEQFGRDCREAQKKILQPPIWTIRRS